MDTGEIKHRRRKPSVKAIKALQLINQGLSKNKAMIQAGYAKSVARTSGKRFFGLKSVQNQIMRMGNELEDAGLSSKYMVGKFKEWLEAKRVVSAKSTGREADEGTDDFIEVPDYKVQLDAYKEWKKIQDQLESPDIGRKPTRKLTIEEFINE